MITTCCFNRFCNFNKARSFHVGSTFQTTQIVRIKKNFENNRVWTLPKQREWLEQFAINHGIKSTSDWHYLPLSRLIKAAGGESLLKVHHSRPFEMLKVVFPEIEWNEQFFVFKGKWTMKTQREFLERFAKENKLKSPEDWASIKDLFHQLQKFGAFGLLQSYQNSPILLLQSVFHEYNWEEIKNKFKFKGKWKHDRKLSVLEEIAKDLKLNCLDDWYNCSSLNRKFQIHGQLLQNKSIFENLSTLYPEYPWSEHKFVISPKSSWNNNKIVRSYFNDMGMHFGINFWMDWYRLSRKQLRDNRGGGVLDRFKNVPECLSVAYPEHEWLSNVKSTTKKKSVQWLIQRFIRKLLPEVNNLIMKEDFSYPIHKNPSILL